MTTLIISLGDAYEISFSHEGVESIVRYPRCRDGRGEVVDYDTLSPRVQNEIYKGLKHKLRRSQREDNGNK